MLAKVSEIMTRDVVCVDSGQPVEKLVEILRDHAIHGAPVVDDDGRLVGVVSMSDVVTASDTGFRGPDFYASSGGDVAVGGELRIAGKVADIMTPRILAATPDTSIRAVCRIMADHGVHRVIVVEDGEVVGVVGSLDVVEWYADHG